MCGRFALLSPGQDLADQFDVTITFDVAPRYNIAPTQPVLAIRNHPQTQKREATFFRWGLVPSWAKDMSFGSRLINARGETVAEKASFRAAFKRRRCLIPATGFYEWQRVGSGKQPTYIHSAGGKPFGLAGLWETWHDADGGAIDSCTIITTTPNDLMEPIHNRMPVIIDPADYSMWLDPGERPSDSLHLIRPYPSEKMNTYPVSPFVNSPRNEGAQCIQPV